MLIELEIYLESTILSDLGVKTESILAPFIFNLNQIEGFRQVATDTGELIEGEIIIYTKSGNYYPVKFNYDDFKTLVYKYNNIEENSDDISL